MTLIGCLVMLVAGEARCPEDACLRGICFTDSKKGWAVGDEGAIWRTIDGGEQWERQIAGTRGTLRRVVFQDAQRGWICGREDGPAGATGVLLVTRDGGNTWQRVLAGAMPALAGISFVSDTEGYLWGDAAGPYSSGLFHTADGGRSWAPLIGVAPGGWVSAHFTGQGAGVLAGRDGRLFVFSGKDWTPAPTDALGNRHVLACRADMACGEEGLLLDNQAGRWTMGRAHIDARALAQTIWRGMARTADRALVVGSPGTMILQSDDGGKHFAPRMTGINQTLHDACLLTDGTGYACGAMGVVIRTKDHGRTWEVARQPLNHAAFLVVSRNANQTPWRTITHVGWEEGLSGVGITLSQDPEPDPLPAAHRRAGLVVSETARDAAGWRERLVLALRQWQPEHLLLACPAADTDRVWLAETAMAIQWAAQAEQYPEQIKELGLKPWLGGISWRMTTGDDASFRLAGSKPSDRLEDTLDGHVSATLSLYGLKAMQLSSVDGWAPFRQKSGESFRSFLAASANRMEGARRPLANIEPLEIATVKALEQRRLHEAMATPGVLPLADGERAAATLAATVDQLDDARGAPFLDRLARGSERSGQWQLARELHAMLVERYPAHPLALSSTRWLIAHESSGEVRRREDLGRTVERAIVQAGMPGNGSDVQRAGPPGPGKRPDAPNLVTQVTRETALVDGRSLTRTKLENCLLRESMLRASGSLAVQDPAVQFMLQSARRQLGRFDQATEYYRKAASAWPKGSLWQSAAETELWLTNRSGDSPRPALACRAATSRPKLDGRLEDICWNGALRPLAGGNPAATVGFSHDADFLYLAARCPDAAPDAGIPATGRKPDTAQESRDHVVIFLDIDRDHSTGYTLTIDDQGRVSDRCCEDPTWDPRWFVAVGREENGWTVEAAIPLTALTGEAVSAGQAWMVQVARKRGESIRGLWSVPAGTTSATMDPSQSGVLLFMPAINSR